MLIVLCSIALVVSLWSEISEIPALKSALAILPTIDFADRKATVAELEPAIKRLMALHEETAAALVQPKAARNPGLVQEHGKVTSAVCDPEARIRPVAGPGSSTAGAETSVRATACATVFPFTSRSSVPASGEALASRTRAVSAPSGPTGSGLQAASGSAVARTAMISKRMRLGLRHLG